MVPLNLLIVYMAVPLPFWIALWLMIFLNTYRHFPKMERGERLRLSAINATVPTLILIGIIYLALWFVLQNFILMG
nr:hypothetical protein [uncultured archaeon]